MIKKLLGYSKKSLPAPMVSGDLDPACVIPRQKHPLSKTHISPNALKVLNKLHHAGYEAYLVGGGVRDLLFNKQPKDFDVATNALPQDIRRLFRNARVIGRRFKLVHVWFHREIIEVATFRSDKPSDEHNQRNQHGMITRDNVYGNLVQDAWRRDFTMNALYYSVESGALIDITGGMADIQKKLLRIIGDPALRYQEDPVRMLRVVRFAAKLNLTIETATAAAIVEWSHLIQQVSHSRLFDEVVKLYQGGYAKAVQVLLVQYGLFAHLFPSVHVQLQNHPEQVSEFINLALRNTDSRIQLDKPVTPAFLFAVLLWFPLQAQVKRLQEDSGFSVLHALEQAMSKVIAAQNVRVNIPKRFVQTMKEIWVLQYRFSKRLGGRAQHLLTHARFRAAYDLLLLRVLVGDAPPELAEWWTQFQELPPHAQEKMVAALKK